MSSYGSPSPAHSYGPEYHHPGTYASPQPHDPHQYPYSQAQQPAAHPGAAYPQSSPGTVGSPAAAGYPYHGVPSAGGYPPGAGYPPGYPGGGAPPPYYAVRISRAPMPPWDTMGNALSLRQDYGVAAPGYGPGPDMQRLWDLSQLQYKVNEMQHHVAVTNEGLLQRDAVAGGVADSTGGSEHGGSAPPVPAEGSFEAMLALPGAYDVTQLPITEGFINRKGGDGGFRVWKSRFMRLDGAELTFAARPEDRPQSRFRLDGRSVVSPGACVRVRSSGRKPAAYP